jgi:hypothetical protein
VQSVQPAVAVVSFARRRQPFGEEEVDVGDTRAVTARKSDKTEGLTSNEAARISALMRDAKVERVAVDAIRPNPRNARRHPPKQLAVLAENIRQFGFTNPILVDEDGEILAGHGRYAAAQLLELPEILIIRLAHLSSAEKRAVALADNKIAELGSWNPDQLKETLTLLVEPSGELSFDAAIIGFKVHEIKSILHPAPPRRPDPADQLPNAGPREHQTVTMSGDVWLCGEHILACGSPFQLSFEQGSAAVAFVDPFPARTAEPNPEKIRQVLDRYCRMIVDQLCPGARIYWFTDWQNAGMLTDAVKPVVGSPRDMIVWVRSDTSAGALYRSDYDQVAVFTVPGGAPVQASPGRCRARHRTNVWAYSGGGRDPDARTVRNPVALLADALKDCSSPGDIVFDPFARSGTTLIAAERTGRCARLIEYDPRWCDLILRRWQEFTKVPAVLDGPSAAFAEVAKERAGDRNGGREP